MHDEGKGLEKMLSLSGAMKAAKLLENHDHDALMNFIMEATGITDAADKIRVFLFHKCSKSIAEL